jgi:hypothetical protein
MEYCIIHGRPTSRGKNVYSRDPIPRYRDPAFLQVAQFLKQLLRHINTAFLTTRTFITDNTRGCFLIGGVIDFKSFYRT